MASALYLLLLNKENFSVAKGGMALPLGVLHLTPLLPTSVLYKIRSSCKKGKNMFTNQWVMS